MLKCTLLHFILKVVRFQVPPSPAHQLYLDNLSSRFIEREFEAGVRNKQANVSSFDSYPLQGQPERSLFHTGKTQAGVMVVACFPLIPTHISSSRKRCSSCFDRTYERENGTIISPI